MNNEFKREEGYLYGDSPEFGEVKAGDEIFERGEWEKCHPNVTGWMCNPTIWRRKLPLPTNAEEAKTDVERCYDAYFNSVKLLNQSAEQIIAFTLKWAKAQKQPAPLVGVREILGKLRRRRPDERIIDRVKWNESIEPLLQQLEALEPSRATYSSPFKIHIRDGVSINIDVQVYKRGELEIITNESIKLVEDIQRQVRQLVAPPSLEKIQQVIFWIKHVLINPRDMENPAFILETIVKDLESIEPLTNEKSESTVEGTLKAFKTLITDLPNPITKHQEQQVCECGHGKDYHLPNAGCMARCSCKSFRPRYEQ